MPKASAEALQLRQPTRLAGLEALDAFLEPVDQQVGVAAGAVFDGGVDLLEAVDVGQDDSEGVSLAPDYSM